MTDKLKKEIMEGFDNLQKNRTIPMSRKEAHEFLSQIIDQTREDEREQMRILLMKILSDVEKEHGSKNVYFDMIEELFTEEIDNL